MRCREAWGRLLGFPGTLEVLAAVDGQDTLWPVVAVHARAAGYAAGRYAATAEDGDPAAEETLHPLTLGPHVELHVAQRMGLRAEMLANQLVTALAEHRNAGGGMPLLVDVGDVDPYGVTGLDLAQADYRDEPFVLLAVEPLG